jgi:hypothetical protein
MVVLSADSPAYTTAASPEEVIARPDGSHPPSTTDAVRQWSDSLRDTVTKLRDRGIPVMFVGAPPAFEGDFPRDHLSLLDPRPALPAPTRDQAEARRTQVWAAEQRVLVGPGVALVDPFGPLCDQGAADGTCPVWVDGTWRYYDDRHLTVAGSLLVGFAQTFGNFYVPELALGMTYALMIIVLVLRPGGLFGRPE